jgi:hypothetical protein
MITAPAEYEKWVAQQRVANGLSKKPPETADRMYAASEQVYDYRVLCAAKDETSVEFMGRMFCCNFLRKSRL